MDIVSDDVVISGIGGYFPKAINMEEFKNRLFENKVLTESRWPEEKSVCNQIGCIDSDHFDNSYFGIHRQQCFFMDPMHRLSLERTFEALVDAGVNPTELRGKRVGVFMGSTIGENDQLFMESVVSGFGVTGHSRAMLANRISYWLNLKGPSVAYDANWISGLEILRLAYYAIKTGQCESVIIGTANLAQHIEFQYMYNQLGLISSDGSTKAFDADASGYARSEGVVVMYIQRSSEARRLYSSVVKVATKFDGTSSGDFMNIDSDNMAEFIEEFYKNSIVKPEEIGFVEAYGCAKKETDKSEVNALEKVYCKNRTEPLLIGSVKTVTGHSEPTAALFSIVKTIIAMETEIIPATLQYNKPNPDIPSLNNGKIEVITTNRKWDPKYAAVNAISTSNYFGHLILKANPKKKVNIPVDLPTLLIVSTRTEEGIIKILELLKKKRKDAEYYKLVQEVFSKSIQGHLYRGFLLLGNETKQEIINHMGNKRPIWFVYSGMGSQWNAMLGDFMRIEVFAESIKRSQKILAKKGVDLMDILTTSDKTIFDNILHCFVGIAAMQIALTDLLTALGIVPDGIIGHSVGELGCAYADGCMTAEQMILSSYSRGRASIEATLIPGMMAAIGLGYNQIKNDLPPTIEVACHNGSDSCTISGPTEDMEVYVKKLQSDGVFAKLVNVANIAYHSRYIKPAAPLLLKYLKEVIPKPVLRSSKWISTSNLESNWDTDLAKHSSAEYHTNNLLSSVLFEEGTKHIPKDCVLIEIAPHGLLQAILKRSAKECTNIPLTMRNSKSATEFFLNSLGKIYLTGVDLKLSNIYPKIEYPVSRNTSSLADLVFWNHSESWSRTDETTQAIIGVKQVDFNLNSDEFNYCLSHKIHNQAVLSLSTYLNVLLQISENGFGGYGVVFENILFKKHVIIPSVGSIQINATVQSGSGEFEVFSCDEMVVSGKLTVIESKDDMVPLEDNAISVTKESIKLSENDFYSELEHRGYAYNGPFKTVKNVTLSQKGLSATTEWNYKWEDLIESMIQQQLFYDGERNQEAHVLKHIQRISMIHSLLPTTTDTKINFEYAVKTISTPGIEIQDIRTIPFQNKELNAQLNSVDIIPLDDNIYDNIEYGIEQALQLTVQNFKDPNVSKISISELETNNSIQEQIKNVCSKYNTLNISLSVIKESKKIVMAESFPQLLLLNDIINAEIIKLLLNSDSAFLLAKIDPNQDLDKTVSIVARFRYGPDHYIICRKATHTPPSILTIKDKFVSKKNLATKSPSWVTDLLKIAKKTYDQQILLLVISSIPADGLNNFLHEVKKITNLQHVRIFCNLDHNPAKIDEAFKKDLTITILKDKRWFTCLPMSLKMNKTSKKRLEHTPILENSSISYIGLNLRDESLTPDLINKNDIGNIDYCGVTKSGQRIMGLAYLDKENSKLVVDDTLAWEIPEEFSLDDAITIPHAYACAYYMMVVKGRMRHGDTVLIHAGCSPIGLAAISVAHSYGCEIFTTVASKRQRVYIKKVYMFLQQRNILDSNSTSFERELMFATGGKGVELLLNCTTGTLLKFSVSCMGLYGKFIQYGKYDVEQGNSIGMSIFLKNVDFYNVDLQNIFHQDKEIKKEIRDLIIKGFKEYVVRPLRKEIISHENISIAMKKLESPEVIGKIIIDAGNNLHINKLNIKNPNRFVCNSQSSYLIFGGSVASWLNIAEWLVHRGARKVVVGTNSNPLENHFNRRISILENYYGANIILASNKIRSKENVVQLVSEVVNLGHLQALFILSNENNIDSTNDYEIVELFDNALRNKSPNAILVNFIESATESCYKRSESGYLAINIEVPSLVDMKIIDCSLDSILYSNCNHVVIKEHIKEDSANDANKAILSDLTKLIPNLEDIIQLQKNAPNEPELVQVLSEGPSEIRELLPVFIIPGLTGYKELELFTRNILYPTFCAVLPSTSWPLHKLAEVYAQKISEVARGNIYNIISISSGGPLAIEIAKIFAKKNVVLNLFFIDSAPLRVQQGLQDLDNNVQIELTLLRTVFEIHDLELIKQVKNCEDFEARLKLLLQRVNQSERNKEFLVKGLIFARDFIGKIKSYKPSKELLSGKIHLLVPEDCSVFENYGLSLYFKNTPSVTQVTGDHLSIIKNWETQEYVNKHHYQF